MSCGYVAACGRPAEHRGHHGGWRVPGDPVVAADPVERDHRMSELGQRLTMRELQVVGEYALHGAYKLVAECLGISEQTSKNHGCSALAKVGAESMAAMPYALGWITMPAGVGHGARVGSW